ncbi:MAG: hypothetical protein AAF628_26265 [Planctomycetota bacterium]
MTELFRWLFDHPLLIILLFGGILQGLGGLGAKAARKAVEQQRQRAAQAQRPGSAGGGGLGPGGATMAAPPTTARSTAAAPTAAGPTAPRPTAQDIAGQIRRAMGIDVIEAAPAPPKPAPASPSLEGAGEVGHPPRVGSTLAMPSMPEIATVGSMRESLIPAGSMAAAAAASGPAPRLDRRASSRRRRQLLDLRNPAAAFVAAEVLGPPIALRERGYGGL